MLRRLWIARLLIALAAVGIYSTAHADFAELTLQSQPGDFIGQGHSFDIVYNTPGSNTLSSQIRRTLNGAPAELLFVVDDNGPTNTFGLLFFGTDQLGIPFQAGTYGLPGNTAERADFADPGHAGLDISFQNRGSNTLTGNFTVNSVSFFTDPNNILEIGSLDVNFEQHSEGAAAALFGHFVFQSALAPRVVPEPASVALMSGGLLGLLTIRRRGLNGGPNRRGRKNRVAACGKAQVQAALK
jgi:hypothetical protein